MYMCACMYVYMYIYIYIYIYMYVCIYVCIYVSQYVYMFVCMYVWIPTSNGDLVHSLNRGRHVCCYKTMAAIDNPVLKIYFTWAV